MSWTFAVPPTPLVGFADAVDAAEPMGQDPALPGMAEDVAAAKAVLRALAERVKRPLVGGNAGGHCLQANEESNWSDNLSASVYGTDAP